VYAPRAVGVGVGEDVGVAEGDLVAVPESAADGVAVAAAGGDGVPAAPPAAGDGDAPTLRVGAALLLPLAEGAGVVVVRSAVPLPCGVALPPAGPAPPVAADALRGAEGERGGLPLPLPLPLTLTLPEAVAPAGRLADAAGEALRAPVALALVEGEGGTEGGAGGVGAPEALPHADAPAEAEALRDAEALPLPRGDGEGEREGEGLCESREGDAEALPRALPLAEADREAEGVAAGEAVALGDAEGGPREGVCVSVGDGARGVGEPLPLAGAAEGVPGGREALGEPLGAACERVPLALGEGGALRVREGGGEGEGAHEGEPAAAGGGEPVAAPPEGEPLTVLAPPPPVRDAAGEGVAEGVPPGAASPVGVGAAGEGVRGADGASEALLLMRTVSVGEPRGEREAEGEREGCGDALCEGGGEGEGALGVGPPLRDGSPLDAPLGEARGDALGLREPLPLRVSRGEGEGEGEGGGEGDAGDDARALRLPDGEPLLRGERLSDCDARALALPNGEPLLRGALPLGECVSHAVGAAVAPGERVAGDAVAAAAGEGEGREEGGSAPDGDAPPAGEPLGAPLGAAAAEGEATSEALATADSEGEGVVLREVEGECDGAGEGVEPVGEGAAEAEGEGVLLPPAAAAAVGVGPSGEGELPPPLPPLRDGSADGEGALAVGAPLPLPLPLPLAGALDAEGEPPPREGEGAPDAEGEPLVEWEAPAERVTPLVESDGEALLSEGVPLALGAWLRCGEREGEGGGDSERLTAPLGEGPAEALFEGADTEGVAPAPWGVDVAAPTLALGAPERIAPSLEEGAVEALAAEGDGGAEGEGDAPKEAVPCEGVGGAVAVAEPEGAEGVGVPELPCLLPLGAALGDAPPLSEARAPAEPRALRDTEGEPLSLPPAPAEGEAPADSDAEGDGNGEGDGRAEAEGEREGAGEALPPRREAEPLADRAPLGVRAAEGEGSPPAGVGVEAAPKLRLSAGESDGDALREVRGEALDEPLSLPPPAEAVRGAEGAADAVVDAEALPVAEAPVGEAVGAPLAVAPPSPPAALPVTEPLPLRVELREGEAHAEAEGAPEARAEGEGELLPPRPADALGAPLAVGAAVVEAPTEADSAPLREGVSASEGLAVGPVLAEELPPPSPAEALPREDREGGGVALPASAA
jgi:hypothetical protein